VVSECEAVSPATLRGAWIRLTVDEVAAGFAQISVRDVLKIYTFRRKDDVLQVRIDQPQAMPCAPLSPLATPRTTHPPLEANSLLGSRSRR